ncbi:protein LAZ1 [Tanacetum coccineum]
MEAQAMSNEAAKTDPISVVAGADKNLDDLHAKPISSCLTRDDTTSVPIWVKFHNVPIMAFSEDGLSLITSKALIEVTLDQDLKKSIVIAIPLPNRAGHKKITIDVEYEWKPPICVDCKIFGHVHKQCPKRVHKAHVAQCKTVDDDGFITVTRKGGKNLVGGKQQLELNIFTLKNSVNALQKEDASFEQDYLDPKVGRENKMAKSNEVNGGYDSDREEVEDVYDKTTESKDQMESKGASTLASGGSHAEGNLHDRVKKLRQRLDEAILNEEMFLKQKSKVEWLQVGDSNTAYFHKVIKSQKSKNRIDLVMDSDGVFFDGEDVPPGFVSHYIRFLGKVGTTSPFDISNLFINTLLSDQAMNMVREVTSEEVKGVIFSMGNEKSPGPDGFTVVFFKEAWDIVGLDVINAVKEFFISGKLLKEINHTIIALIPKVPSPTRINDYRLISCCNVLLKCITKIISNRLKDCLKHLVSINQSTFVPGRGISDNILLTQEIMHNYHLDRGPTRCAFKVDIQKAYDTVDWGFLKKVLIGFGFHSTMVGWIMECVTSISFSLCINGVLHGFFKGKCGLRQVIMDFLDEFKSISGLVPSIPKSTTYFYNVLNHTKLDILHVLPFEEGTLLVKYLGVPLVTIRLVIRDCKELVINTYEEEAALE